MCTCVLPARRTSASLSATIRAEWALPTEILRLMKLLTQTEFKKHKHKLAEALKRQRTSASRAAMTCAALRFM